MMSPGGGDEASALLQQIVGAGGPWIERAARYGKNLSPLFAGKAGGDQRARALGRLGHHHAERDSGDQPVAAGKVLSPRRESGRPLADEHSPLADGAVQLLVLGRINIVDAAGEHGDGAMVERGGVRRRVDAAGKPRGDDKSFNREAGGRSGG
jgi:hypothetical protein